MPRPTTHPSGMKETELSAPVSMQAPGQTAGRFYRPELDVVRFLAFLLVFIHHALPAGPDPRSFATLKTLGPMFYAVANAGRFGLSLFFTLSAFLICELLLRERRAVGAVVVKQFYVRRILRIWPLYYLGLALGILAAFLPGGDRAELPTIGWYALFLGAWHNSFYGWLKNPASPLWSISVEEQFYLLAPWVVKYLNRKSLYAFCAALILFANGWLYYLGKAGAPDNRIWSDSFVQFECFAAGILLCLILRGRLPRIAVWQRLLLIFASLAGWYYAAYALNFRFSAGANPGSWALIAAYALGAAGSALILIAALGVNPRLLPRWAVYLGRISFGLYVYHHFVIDLMDNLMPHVASMKSPLYLLKGGLSLGLIFLVAATSYRYFETPFLRMKKRHAVIESQPISGAG